MTQIPILSGIYSTTGVDIGVAYPKNLVPTVEKSAVSNGYLRTPQGATTFAEGPGFDRGGIVWNGAHYRAMGTKLVRVTGSISEVGDVGPGGLVSLSYSFDRLIIRSEKNLYYYDGTLVKVTDPDLGDVLDCLWMDGFTVTTDGTSIVVCDLNDPTSVDPLKYGSSEADPDPIKGLVKIRGELYVCNRHSIEIFSNLGTAGFPFGRIRGAEIPKGIVGVNAKCTFLETFAFCGSGRDEGIGIHLAGSGQAVKISSRAVDMALAELNDEELASIVMESRQGNGSAELFIHLPEETFVYSYSASQALDLPVWYRLGSGIMGQYAYRPRNYTLVDNRWICGDLTSYALGAFDDEPTHFGDVTGWEFATPILYNDGNGAIIHQMELATQTGRAAFGDEGTVMMSASDDNLEFGQERASRYGTFGGRFQRPTWFGCGMFRNRRIVRFRGQNTAPVSFLRLEARMEGLNG